MQGVGLSEPGKAQARRLADRFADTPLTAIVASPQRRAQETAAPIAARLGLPVTPEPGLDEIDFGAWSGQPFDALDPDPAWQAWNRHRSLAPCPGGETMLQAQSRALDCLHRLARDHPGGDIVLVSHQDVIKAVLAHLLGASLDHLPRFALDPASRSTIAWTPEATTILTLNHPP